MRSGGWRDSLKGNWEKQVPGSSLDSRGWNVRFCFDLGRLAGATRILGTWWVVCVAVGWFGDPPAPSDDMSGFLVLCGWEGHMSRCTVIQIFWRKNYGTQGDLKSMIFATIDWPTILGIFCCPLLKCVHMICAILVWSAICDKLYIWYVT